MRGLSKGSRAIRRVDVGYVGGRRAEHPGVERLRREVDIRRDRLRLALERRVLQHEIDLRVDTRQVAVDLVEAFAPPAEVVGALLQNGQRRDLRFTRGWRQPRIVQLALERTDVRIDLRRVGLCLGAQQMLPGDEKFQIQPLQISKRLLVGLELKLVTGLPERLDPSAPVVQPLHRALAVGSELIDQRLQLQFNGVALEHLVLRRDPSKEAAVRGERGEI